jgi:hypothetical protein
MQKSTIVTTIFRVKKCYFHYVFSCKRGPLSLRYAKKKCFLGNYNFCLSIFLLHYLHCERETTIFAIRIR